jgi:hypothetical protein
MKNIYTAFVKAQKEFAPALKTSTNPHFKSKYVSLDGCIEAVIDALNNNGIGLIQQNHEAEHGVTVETLLIHESGESLSGGKLFVPATKQDAQGFGSALTYARRYSLMATCGIAPEDDDGNAASYKPAAPKVNEAEAIAKIRAVKTLEELTTAWNSLPVKTPAIVKAKDEMKSLFEGAQ